MCSVETSVEITPAFRTRILTGLQEAQSKTARIKILAKVVDWWPSIDAEVKQLVRKCEICQINRPNFSSAPLQPREWPKTMVKSTLGLCCCIAKSFLWSMYPVILDAHSKWIKVYKTGQTFTGLVTVRKLQQAFV